LGILNPITIKLEETELIQSLGGKVPRLKEEVGSILKQYASLIEPKAVYTSSRVKSIEHDRVHFDKDVVLKGLILADMLELGQEVVPYVVTVGPELENKASEEGSLLREWIIEKMADYALEKATAQVKSQVTSYASKVGNVMSTFSPGTGTGELFGIEQQENLFRLVDSAESIGVRLTPSHLMVPRKSVSGILAATNEEYVACEYCPRVCDSRRKPFRGGYRPRSKNT